MEQNKNNRELGDGTFSKVYKYIQGSNTYAVKIITKSNCNWLIICYSWKRRRFKEVDGIWN